MAWLRVGMMSGLDLDGDEMLVLTEYVIRFSGKLQASGEERICRRRQVRIEEGSCGDPVLVFLMSGPAA
jgi:hypothetical protein